MLNLVSEYFNAASPVPLTLSAVSPLARRAVESSSRGYVVKGLRTHHEEFRKDEEVSCHRRPTRTVCIHADALPQTFFNALWWIQRDGADVPLAFRAARLNGVLHYGVPAVISNETASAPTAVHVLSTQDPVMAAFVARTVSLFVGGSRLREIVMDPSAAAQLERIDVSNCRCLKSLQWYADPSSTAAAGVPPQQLPQLHILKASFSGLVSFPAPQLAQWAPALTTALLSGCRALSEPQVNAMLAGCTALRVARLDSTKLSSIHDIAATCPLLAELNASNCAELREVRAVAQLRCLRVLDLHGNANLASLVGLGMCSKLRRLDVSLCKRITTLRPLDGAISALEHFNASHCTGLRDTQLDVLQGCPMLEEVKVDRCAALQDFSALAGHANLLVLQAADTGLASVEFLQSCTALEQLTVAGCAELKDLDPLRGLYRLSTIDACYTGVTRVAELVDSCAALRVVLMRECELDAESTGRLEACAQRIASTHRTVHTNNNVAATA